MSVYFLCRFVAVLLVHECFSATRQEVMVYEELSDCGNADSITHLINPRIVTLQPSGLTVCRIDVNISKDSEVKVLAVDTFVCDSKRQNCIKFLSWTRDNEDVCLLGIRKNLIWSPLLATQPQVQCPVVRKGLYHVENGSLDVTKLGMLSIPDNKYIRIKINLLDEKRRPFLCIRLGALHKFIGRPK